MYYDSYERWNGDGFYPLVVRDGPCQTPIDIEFELHGNELTQLSGPYICGYDGNTKQEIIKSMLEFEEVNKELIPSHITLKLLDER